MGDYILSGYISKEKLMAYPIRRDNYDTEHGDPHFINGVESVLEYAEALPEEDVAPVVHGRWVHPKGYVVSNGFLCSECNYATTSYRPIRPCGNGVCLADENGNFYYPPNMNYCPSCGAKMDLDDIQNKKKELVL